MGLFRGAVFCYGGGALKQPIKEATETPTSTLALMGRFPSLMGRFPTLMGCFAKTAHQEKGHEEVLERFLRKCHCEIKGRFRNLGWFWRTYPRSGFRSGGTCESTLVPVFVPWNIRMYPRSGFRSGATSAKTTLLEPPFCRPQKMWRLLLLKGKGGATTKRHYQSRPLKNLPEPLSESKRTSQRISCRDS